MSYIKTAAVGLVAGLIAGVLVGGIGGRIIMRLVVLSTSRNPEFTLEGTLNLVLVGAIMGALGGLIFVSVRRFLPIAAPMKGTLYGVLAFLILFAPTAFDSMSELFLASPLLGLALFAALFIIYGIVVQELVSLISHEHSSARSERL